MMRCRFGSFLALMLALCLCLLPVAALAGEIPGAGENTGAADPAAGQGLENQDGSTPGKGAPTGDEHSAATHGLDGEGGEDGAALASSNEQPVLEDFSDLSAANRRLPATTTITVNGYELTIENLNAGSLSALVGEIVADNSDHPQITSPTDITGLTASGSLNGDDLDYIWKGAFGNNGINCSGSLTGLTELDLSGAVLAGLDKLPDYQFAYFPLVSVALPGNLEAVGDYAFYTCSRLQSLDLSACESLRSIGNRTFWNCTALDSVDLCSLPALETIGIFSFRGCTSLTSLTLPEDMVSIGDSSFAASGLTDVQLPGDLKTIGPSIFQDCKSLRQITLPGSLESIGIYTFWGCSNLTDIDFSACQNLQSIGDYTFDSCGALVTVNLSPCTALQTTGKYTFQSCSKLTGITLPDGLVEIGDFTFQYCSVLPSIDLPDSVERIGVQAFRQCPELTSVSFPANLTTIDNHAFLLSKKLREADLSACSALESIGQSAFGACYDLNRVSLPAGLRSIGAGAFSNCTGLTSLDLSHIPYMVEIEGTGSGLVFYNTNNVRISVPQSLLSTYQNDSVWALNMSNAGIQFDGDTTSYTLTLHADPAQGRVIGAGNGASVGIGQQLTLQAIANPDHLFDRWEATGAVGFDPTSETTTFTVMGNAVISAFYKTREYSIAVSADPPEGGTVSGGGSAPASSEHTVTATPNSGWVFVNWTENSSEVSTALSYRFPVTDNRTLVANFQPETVPPPSTSGGTTGSGGNGGSSLGSAATTLPVTPARQGWNGSGDLVFTVEGASPAALVSVRVDGTALDTDSYSVYAGSVILTLPASYLGTLADGDHSLVLQFWNSSATADFTVNRSAVDVTASGAQDGVYHPDDNPNDNPGTGAVRGAAWRLGAAGVGLLIAAGWLAHTGWEQE